MKKVTAVLVVVVMLLGLVPMAIAAPPNPGSGSTNFTVQNLGGAEATVTAAYVNPLGEIDASIPKPIASLASDGFPAAQSGLDDGWIGSVVVSADQEIVAFAQMLWVGGTAGNTVGAYNGFTEGSPVLYLPSLASRTPQYSVISVQSAEAPAIGETVAFTIEFYDREGDLSHFINDTVVKGAQVSYSLSPDDMAQLGGNWLGSAVIQAADDTSPLAAVATMHWNQYSAAYSAVTGGGTRISLPSATRRKPTGPWLQFTGVVVQNLDATQEAEVKVIWYDRDGSELHSFETEIPANSAHGYNTRFVEQSQIPTLEAAFDAAIGDNFNGSVVIESKNDAEIVAVANLQWTADHPARAAASAYTSESSGYETVYVPATFRRVGGAGWIQFTGLIVQNVGTTACENFTVSWVARDTGQEVMSFQDSLDPNIAAGYNTNVGADIPANVNFAELLTNDFRGAVTIEADGCELIGIHNTVWPVQTDSSTYNAFGR